MNRYGKQAMRHWQEHRPRAYQELTDPEEFFTAFGEEISQAIEERARALAGRDPQGEGFLQKARRLNTARFEAEATVLREMVLLEVEEEAEQP